MPLDPQVQTVLDQFQELGFPGFAALDVSGARAVISGMACLQPRNTTSSSLRTAASQSASAISCTMPNPPSAALL